MQRLAAVDRAEDARARSPGTSRKRVDEREDPAFESSVGDEVACVVPRWAVPPWPHTPRMIAIGVALLGSSPNRLRSLSESSVEFP